VEKRGLGNFLQKRTETTYLAKILQVFLFSGKERRRVLKGCLWE
jgi:hypothetical protein